MTRQSSEITITADFNETYVCIGVIRSSFTVGSITGTNYTHTHTLPQFLPTHSLINPVSNKCTMNSHHTTIIQSPNDMLELTVGGKPR